MATLREIRQRIRGIKSTQQITRAMKMVAAAKMRRAQEGMFNARPYAGKIKELVEHLVSSSEGVQLPLLQERPVRRLTLVVITADRGLCGSFNSNIIKKALGEFDIHKEKEISLLCVGRKGFDFFRKRNHSIIARHYINVFNALELSHANDIARYLIDQFTGDGTDAVRIIYNQFKSVAQQTLVTEDLLPLKVSAPQESAPLEERRRPIDYLYEPSKEALLKALLPRHIRMQIWRALLESYASEQAARMMAMENATANAREMIESLTLEFNKARQASITKEILEIVGGAEALKKASA